MRLNTEEKQMIVERLTKYNLMQSRLEQEKFDKELNVVLELPEVKQFIKHVKDLIPEAQDKDFKYDRHWNTETTYVYYHMSTNDTNSIYIDVKYITDIPYPRHSGVPHISTTSENLSKYYVIFSTWDVNRKNKLEKLEELINLIITEETKEK